jgi:protein tyrosine/serine phosphatase
VFFHCARGADRTGMFGAIYRIEVEGWTNAEAIEEMQAFGYNDFYKDLIGYVRDYRPRD